MAAVLELSDWEFKIIMINMSKRLTEKVDHMKGQMANISRNGEKERIKVLEIKNTIIEMMNPLMASLIDWTQPGKELRT